MRRDPVVAVVLQLHPDPEKEAEYARASVRYRLRRKSAQESQEVSEEDMPRVDDANRVLVEKRIRTFQEETLRLFDAYKAENQLLIIPAEPTFDYDTLPINDKLEFPAYRNDVYTRMVEALNNR